MKLIFLGPPGVGKGTIAKMVSRDYNIPQISTGDLLRAELKLESELGQKAKEYIEGGHLVPDELVINLLKNRINKEDCENGFILDGFPRTIPQAKALLEHGITIDKVINFTSPNEVIIKRLSSRRTCKNCGAIYNIITVPPKVENTCDKCQGELFQRDDDKPEAIKNRLVVYKLSTEPLIEFYETQGKLVSIDGTDTPQIVYEKTKEILK